MSDEAYVDLRVISLGAGVQSSTMYLLFDRGMLGPKPELAVFADTGAEPPWVYEQVAYLERVGTIPIWKATHPRMTITEAVALIRDPIAGVPNAPSIPFWLPENGRARPGSRQCTREFKIDVVRRAIREYLGLKRGERAPGRFRVEQSIGISLDEAHRAKPSPHSWIANRWPLLYDKPMRRAQCVDWLKANDFAVPKKSSCFFCPYRDNAGWRQLRDEAPELWRAAIAIDDSIRENGRTLRGRKDLQYVHRSLRPLREVDIEEVEDAQYDLFGNECEGMCGV